MKAPNVGPAAVVKPRHAVGRRGRGGRGALSYRIVVDASLRLVDEHGIEALSMRSLGAELGVEAMSLYHYVRNKEELVEGLMAAMDSEVMATPLSGSWRRRLEQIADAIRASFLRHPEAAKLYAVRPASGPSWAGTVEGIHDALREAGLNGVARVHAYRLFSAYVTGYALGEVRQLGVKSLAERLTGLDPAAYPLAWELAHGPSTRGDREFRSGLGVILDGVAARARAAKRRS